MDTSDFHVVCMISNPVRFASRYRLFDHFKAHMHASGVKLWTCEVQQGDRPFAVTHRGNHHDLQLRTYNELWHKENAINEMVARLPYDWKYVAWIDADLTFQRPDWAIETVHQLQHHRIVQMFQNAVDLGPTGEAIATHVGFAWSHVRCRPRGKGYAHWHPGYAWACRRDAWDAMGGLLDFSILGAGDNHIAHALVGRVRESVAGDVSGPYFDALDAYQEQCVRWVRRDIGFVPGTILHHWHGKKRERFYTSRWKILVDTAFDPNKDLKEDYQGLYQIADHGDLRSIEIRDRIRAYFRSRNEDSIDLE